MPTLQELSDLTKKHLNQISQRLHAQVARVYTSPVANYDVMPHIVYRHFPPRSQSLNPPKSSNKTRPDSARVGVGLKFTSNANEVHFLSNNFSTAHQTFQWANCAVWLSEMNASGDASAQGLHFCVRVPVCVFNYFLQLCPVKYCLLFICIELWCLSIIQFLMMQNFDVLQAYDNMSVKKVYVFQIYNYLTVYNVDVLHLSNYLTMQMVDILQLSIM